MGFGNCSCGNPFQQRGGYFELGMCGVCVTGEAKGIDYRTLPCPRCKTIVEYDGPVTLCFDCRNAKPGEVAAKKRKRRRKPKGGGQAGA